MPIPTVFKFIRQLKTEGESGTCPVCNFRMELISDGMKKITKCLRCGYSHIPTGSLSDQRAFDYKLTVVRGEQQKAGFFEFYQPIAEVLYNKIVMTGRTPEEAAKEVILDLSLSEDQAEYFMSKLNFYGKD